MKRMIILITIVLIICLAVIPAVAIDSSSDLIQNKGTRGDIFKELKDLFIPTNTFKDTASVYNDPFYDLKLGVISSGNIFKNPMTFPEYKPVEIKNINLITDLTKTSSISQNKLFTNPIADPALSFKSWNTMYPDPFKNSMQSNSLSNYKFDMSLFRNIEITRQQNVIDTLDDDYTYLGVQQLNDFIDGQNFEMSLALMDGWVPTFLGTTNTLFQGAQLGYETAERAATYAAIIDPQVGIDTNYNGILTGNSKINLPGNGFATYDNWIDMRSPTINQIKVKEINIPNFQFKSIERINVPEIDRDLLWENKNFFLDNPLSEPYGINTPRTTSYTQTIHFTEIITNGYSNMPMGPGIINNYPANVYNPPTIPQPQKYVPPYVPPIAPIVINNI